MTYYSTAKRDGLIVPLARILPNGRRPGDGLLIDTGTTTSGNCAVRWRTLHLAAKEQNRCRPSGSSSLPAGWRAGQVNGGHCRFSSLSSLKDLLILGWNQNVLGVVEFILFAVCCT
jgi:hypothetical protein